MPLTAALRSASNPASPVTYARRPSRRPRAAGRSSGSSRPPARPSACCRRSSAPRPARRCCPARQQARPGLRSSGSSSRRPARTACRPASGSGSRRSAQIARASRLDPLAVRACRSRRRGRRRSPPPSRCRGGTSRRSARLACARLRAAHQEGVALVGGPLLQRALERRHRRARARPTPDDRPARADGSPSARRLAQHAQRLDAAADAFDLGDDVLLGVDVDPLRVELDRHRRPPPSLTDTTISHPLALAFERASSSGLIYQFGGVERVLGRPILGLAAALVAPIGSSGHLIAVRFGALIRFLFSSSRLGPRARCSQRRARPQQRGRATTSSSQ